VAAGEENEDDRWQTVVAVDGRTSEVVLEVPARASLHGRITSNGEPLDDAFVSLLRDKPGENEDLILQFRIDIATYSPEGFDSTDRTDGKGNYKIDEVAMGSYRISVTHEDRALPYTLPIEVSQGDNRINIDLPMTAIEGRVTDTEGRPVKATRVRAIPAAALGEQQAGREALSEIFGRNRRRGSVRTDDNGNYRLLGVPADRAVVVEARADDDLVPARSEPITLSHGELRRGIDLELTIGGVLLVQVQGDTSAFSFLSASYEGESESKPGVKMARVRNNGTATFNGLKPGPWRVKFAEDEGGGGEGVVVEVSAGQVTTVEL
jgi:hypothetical protein